MLNIIIACLYCELQAAHLASDVAQQNISALLSTAMCRSPIIIWDLTVPTSTSETDGNLPGIGPINKLLSTQ